MPPAVASLLLPAADRQLSDDDLVRRAWDGEDDALTTLLDRYRGFVRLKAKTYFLVGADREDVIQEGMVGLYKAIRDYDPEQQKSFRGFAELCIVRQIITAIKTATRHKHSALNGYVSLHAPYGDDGDLDLAEQLAGSAPDPCDRVVSAAEVDGLRQYFARILSDLEVEVLRRYVAGQSYAEIATELERHVKSIDNALQRIKRKLDGYLAERRLAEAS